MSFLRERFGYVPDLHFFASGKRKVRAVVKEGADERADLKGVYVGKKAPYGFIISVEGSFLVGRGAKKGIIELNDEEFDRWMSGQDLELREDLPKGVYIVKYQEVFAGSGYFNGRVLKNLLPRVRIQ